MTLKAQNLTAERNERCLFSGMDFTLKPGEVLQVVGANGAGKTTLLRMMAGLLPPIEGQVLWHNEPIQRCRETYFSELIYMGHQLGVKAGLTPHENLSFSARLAGVSWEAFDAAKAIEMALTSVGLKGLEHRETRLLSAGQQRRVGLARLALLSAKLWILDEPLAALDTSGITIVENLIAQHAVQGGMVLMTSHQPLHLDGVSLSILDLNT